MNRYNLIFNSKSGFTLIEVLISLTLLSFVMVGVITLTTDSTNTKERIVEEDKERLTVESAFTKFDWDFTHLYSPLYFAMGYKVSADGSFIVSTDGDVNPNLRYQNNEHFALVDINSRPVPVFSTPDKSTFEFFTASHRRFYENTKQSTFQWVRYALVPDDRPEDDEELKAKKGRYLWVRYSDSENLYRPEKLDISKLKAQVILDSVEELEFSFWDEINKRWLFPIESVPMGKFRPRAVQVKLKWKDHQGHEFSFSRVFRPLWPVFIPDNQEKAELAQNLANPGVVNGQQPLQADPNQMGMPNNPAPTPPMGGGF